MVDGAVVMLWRDRYKKRAGSDGMFIVWIRRSLAFSLLVIRLLAFNLLT